MKKSCIYEEVSQCIVGRWKDIIHRKDGTFSEGEHGTFEWGRNQIQDSFLILLASLSARDPVFTGIQIMAVGSGLVGWDTVPPTKARSATTLQTEVFRKVVDPGDMAYLDPDTNLPVLVASRKIEITSTLGYSEANGTLREFGLFGGDASLTANSGRMVNWISHGRIEKDATMQIVRKVRLEFVLPAQP